VVESVKALVRLSRGRSAGTSTTTRRCRETGKTDDVEFRHNVRFSIRTAQAYMRVAERWPELEAKAQPVALLTFKDALAFLSEPESEDEEHVGDHHHGGDHDEGEPEGATAHHPMDDEGFEGLHQHMSNSWDEGLPEEFRINRDQALARLFVESGWPAERIARKMMRSVEWVERMLEFGRFLRYCKTREVESTNLKSAPFGRPRRSSLPPRRRAGRARKENL
jgi:hypothetical protein